MIFEDKVVFVAKQLNVIGFGYPGIEMLDLTRHNKNFIDVLAKENEPLKNNFGGCFGE